MSTSVVRVEMRSFRSSIVGWTLSWWTPRIVMVETDDPSGMAELPVIGQEISGRFAADNTRRCLAVFSEFIPLIRWGCITKVTSQEAAFEPGSSTSAAEEKFSPGTTLSRIETTGVFNGGVSRTTPLNRRAVQLGPLRDVNIGNSSVGIPLFRVNHSCLRLETAGKVFQLETRNRQNIGFLWESIFTLGRLITSTYDHS